MKAGKISETVLARSVLKQLRTTRAEVLAAPAEGSDAAVIRAGEQAVACAVSAMPLTAPARVPFNIYTAANNLACRGVRPVGILVGLMLPTSASEQVLRGLTGEIESVCAREHMQVLGGHTEVTRLVAEPLVTVTAVGMAAGEAVVSGGVKPGMEIVMAGGAGLAGAALLAREREEELKSRYAQPFIDRAKTADGDLSVCAAAQAAAQAGVCAMHDISEGGVFGALWELGAGAGVGMKIWLKEIPIRQETVEVSEFFQINPYKLLSTGSLLAVAEDGEAVVSAIRRAQGDAAVIGRVTDGSDRVLLCGEERRFLERPQTDEFYKAIRS